MTKISHPKPASCSRERVVILTHSHLAFGRCVRHRPIRTFNRARSAPGFQRVVLFLLLVAFTLTVACGRGVSPSKEVPAWGRLSPDALKVDVEGRHGGTLVVGATAEPKSFNRIVSIESSTALIVDRIFADLIHINRLLQRPEPALAKGWEFSKDGKTLTMHLREGVNFSDGHPFTADDVVFTFEVLYDPKISSPQKNKLMVNGQPFKVEKLGSHTVRFSFADIYAAAERAFDSVFMLPKHKLEAAWKAGEFDRAWNLSTPPADVVGLGPFMLKSYAPGQFVELVRNPHYWKVDRRGQRLPYLDKIRFVITPDRNNELLQFQTGQFDVLSEIRPEDFSALQNQSAEKQWRVIDVGSSTGSEMMWFNQNRGLSPSSRKPIVEPKKLKWFTNDTFRQAISYAIDRGSMIKLVYEGRGTPAYTIFTPGNKLWFNAQAKTYDYNPAQARKLLTEAGFSYKRVGGEDALFDREGNRVEFTLLTNAGNRVREKLGALIQDDLKKIGIRVHFTPLEFNALIDKIAKNYAYDACLLGLSNVDIDPVSQMNVWLSSAPNHQWFPGQKTPATAWEARIDELMKNQISETNFANRKKSFDEVQAIVADKLPFIYLVSKNVLVAAQRPVGNFKPSVLDHPTLWNVEELYFTARPSR